MQTKGKRAHPHIRLDSLSKVAGVADSVVGVGLTR